MNHRTRRRIAVAAALPTALAVALYGILAAIGIAPGRLLPSLAVATLVLGAFTYIRLRKATAETD
ncbi:hypothetical protein [Nocardia wallacei]|uniref:hypothetical protein n=1 Tax=Nocardia wallacei TaxID=480035 RepID=UPI00245469D6|nr:hypothetical protein [Nocardia wallacei]